jgi:Ser/Thr protein kinase RdoA (MazF antagonist)
MLETALLNYGMEAGLCNITTIGSGLINHTWKINFQDKQYILQRINDNVFKHPQYIDDNVGLVADYLKAHEPGYFFVSPVKSLSGKTMVYCDQFGYFRLIPFVENSKTYVATENPKQAYEAAKQFGMFTKLLSEFPQEKLKTVIPDFHNLSLRYTLFKEAMKNAEPQRLNNAKDSIDYLCTQQEIVDTYERILHEKEFKKRVTHYDTKISNVLFNNQDEGICVIDLDTIMPGYFISDVGDMFRTYVCPVTEEEKDISKITIREDYFKAVVDGYLSQMKNELSVIEKEHIVYAGKFMLYMQAVRFLTDYLNNDVYYGAKYDGHNLVRANNQIALLEALLAKEQILSEL